MNKLPMKKREGTIQSFTRKDGSVYFRARVTLGDGFRQWVDVPEGKRSSETAAQNFAAYVQEQEDAHGLLLAKRQAKLGVVVVQQPAATETCDEWSARYFALHERRGTGTVKDMKWCWGAWISPEIGSTPIALLSRQKVMALRNELTRAMNEDDVSAKTVTNAWTVLTAALARAFSDDCPGWESICVSTTTPNPASGMKPPATADQRDEDKRDRQWLYPREFARLVACEEISLAWRRTHALAAYLFLRPGELRALRWSDVDFEACEIRVRRAWDSRARKVQDFTKSAAGMREVAIFPALLPLLRAMKDEAGDVDELLAPLASLKHAAAFTREHLTLAKVGTTRKELVDGSSAHMPFDFRSWRTTGITWCVLAGYDSASIVQWAGHEDVKTTLASYIKQGRDLRQRHGEPFASLEALYPAETSKRCLTEPVSSEENRWRRRESKTRGMATIRSNCTRWPRVEGVRFVGKCVIVRYRERRDDSAGRFVALASTATALIIGTLIVSADEQRRGKRSERHPEVRAHLIARVGDVPLGHDRGRVPRAPLDILRRISSHRLCVRHVSRRLWNVRSAGNRLGHSNFRGGTSTLATRTPMTSAAATSAMVKAFFAP